MLGTLQLVPVTAPWLMELAVDEELVYFDRPICLLLKDGAGNHYLAHYLDPSSGGHELWLVAPIQTGVVPRLLCGGIGLLEALGTPPENSRVVAEVGRASEDTYSFRALYRSPSLESLAQFLPKPGFLFFEDEFEDYLATEFEPMAEYARQRGTDAIDLRFFGEGMSLFSFPLTTLARLGQAVQRLITDLAAQFHPSQSLGKRGTSHGEFERGCQFAAVELAPGSVRLRLEAVGRNGTDGHPPLLREEDYAHLGAQKLAELLQNPTPNDVCVWLSNCPPRIRTNLLSLVGVMKKDRLGMAFEWGSRWETSPVRVDWQPTHVAAVATAVDSLELSGESDIDATGFFDRALMDTGRFRFKDIETRRTFEGRFSPDIEEEAITATRDATQENLYRVTVRETIENQAGSTDPRYRYTFLEVEPLG